MTWPSEPQDPYQPPRPGQPSAQQPPFPPPYGQQPYQQLPPYEPQPSTQPYQQLPTYQQQYQQPYAQPYQQQPYGQQPPPYQPYQAFPPPRRHSRALPWLIALGVVVSVAIMVAVALPVALRNTARCGSERAPLGASPAAVAYVHAINASTPEWMAMSKTIADQGYKVKPEQMTMQLAADQKFVTALKGIQFPAAQQPAAQNLITAVEQYDAFVQTASENPGFLSEHQADDQALNNNRAAASSVLRQQLHLPASRCSYNRP